MAVIHTYVGHNGCIPIRNYLERDGRAIACDGNLIGRSDRWAEQMNRTRHLYGHDKLRHAHGRRCRNRCYYHMTIRPDSNKKDFPANLSLEALQSLASQWADKHFADYEYMIVYHRNEEKDPITKKVIGYREGYHAHVVVNCTNLETGKKLHTSDTEAKKLANSLNVVARRLGLSTLPDLPTASFPEPTQDLYLTRAERGLLSRGTKPYKQVMREAIEIAANHATDFSDFQARLRLSGLDCWRTKRGITFQNSSGWKCRDKNLGAGFRELYLSRLYHDKTYLIIGAKHFEHFDAEVSQKGALVRSSQAQELLNTVATIRREDITSFAAFDARLEVIAEGSLISQTSYAESMASLQELNDVMAQLKIWEQTSPTAQAYEQIRGSKKREAFLDVHGQDIEAWTQSIDALERAGYQMPKDADLLYQTYQKAAKTHQALQSSVGEGGERAKSLSAAKKTTAAVLRDFAAAEAAERAYFGLDERSGQKNVSVKGAQRSRGFVAGSPSLTRLMSTGKPQTAPDGRWQRFVAFMQTQFPVLRSHAADKASSGQAQAFAEHISAPRRQDSGRDSADKTTRG